MHDAILVSISFTWEPPVAEVRFVIVGGQESAIRCIGVSQLTVPRREEWGPSIYVNQVHEMAPGENGERVLRIEMQSGDVIEITAEKFEVPSLFNPA